MHPSTSIRCFGALPGSCLQPTQWARHQCQGSGSALGSSCQHSKGSGNILGLAGISSTQIKNKGGQFQHMKGSSNS